MLVLYCLGFLYVQGFCRSRYLYVYGGLIWFPIRGSCLSLSLIGDYIQVAIFHFVFVGSCSMFSCLSALLISVTVCFVECSFVNKEECTHTTLHLGLLLTTNVTLKEQVFRRLLSFACQVDIISSCRLVISPHSNVSTSTGRSYQKNGGSYSSKGRTNSILMPMILVVSTYIWSCSVLKHRLDSKCLRRWLVVNDLVVPDNISVPHGAERFQVVLCWYKQWIHVPGGCKDTVMMIQHYER